MNLASPDEMATKFGRAKNHLRWLLDPHCHFRLAAKVIREGYISATRPAAQRWPQ